MSTATKAFRFLLQGQRRPLIAGLCCAALIAASTASSQGCKSKSADIGLSKEKRSAPFTDIPVPAADGPKLIALKEGTKILAAPKPDAEVIGELRLGGTVARSPEPYGYDDCDGGYYAIRPRGFVCAGIDATLATNTAALLPPAPDLTKALPYRYARTKSENVPGYERLPTLAEQNAKEPDLTKHLARFQGIRDPLGPATNDVPLDPRGVPTGPYVLLPTGEGIDTDNRRNTVSWFNFPEGDRTPLLLPLSALSGKADENKAIRKGSGLAITGTVTTDGGPAPRKFGITPDGRLIPIDRLKASLGSIWHGIDVEKIGLPIGFIHRNQVHAYSLERGKATALDEEHERRTPIALTGRFRTVNGIRFEQSKEGYWLRAQDIIVVVRRSKFPDFAKGTQKWIDVSIANQTLTAYEGTKPIYATLISSGRDQLKDPATSASTARGIFSIKSKHITRTIDPREVANEFDISDAPWVMEFEAGNAIHGMYWSESVGEAHGFHNIALTPIDAHRLFAWSDPQIPEGWHAVYASGEGSTIINIRP